MTFNRQLPFGALGAFCLLFVLSAQFSALHAQPAALNHVLSLSGRNGFLVWLPNDLPTRIESQ